MTKTKMIAGISLAAVFAISAGLLSITNFAQEASAGLFGFPVSETVTYNNVPMKDGELAVLMDTTPGSMAFVHVAANLPCDENDDPLVRIIVGQAGGNLVPIIDSSSEFTGFTGISSTCVYHNTVDAGTAGGILTDVIIQNISGENVPLPKGTTITMTGTVSLNG